MKNKLTHNGGTMEVVETEVETNEEETEENSTTDTPDFAKLFETMNNTMKDLKAEMAELKKPKETKKEVETTTTTTTPSAVNIAELVAKTVADTLAKQSRATLEDSITDTEKAELDTNGFNIKDMNKKNLKATLAMIRKGQTTNAVNTKTKTVGKKIVTSKTRGGKSNGVIDTSVSARAKALLKKSKGGK